MYPFQDRDIYYNQSIGDIMREKIPVVTIEINTVKFIMPNYIQLELFIIISTGHTV